MILEIQKINNQFVLKNPPKINLDQFFLQIEKKNILKEKPKKQIQNKTDIVLEKLKALEEKCPEDNLLKVMLKYYKPHDDVSVKSDDEVYHEYLMERYGK